MWSDRKSTREGWWFSWHKKIVMMMMIDAITIIRWCVSMIWDVYVIGNFQNWSIHLVHPCHFITDTTRLIIVIVLITITEPLELSGLDHWLCSCFYYHELTSLAPVHGIDHSVKRWVYGLPLITPAAQIQIIYLTPKHISKWRAT